MRQRNWRLVGTGLLLLVLAIGFFFFMLPLGGSSNDPVMFTKLIGQVSGVVGGLSVALVIFGLIGKKV